MDGDLSDDKGVCTLRRPKQSLSELWIDCNKMKCPPSPSTCCTKCGNDGSVPGLLPDTGSGNSGDNGDLAKKLRAEAIKIKLEDISFPIGVGEARKKALDWITNTDSMNLSALSPILAERYILALFYYALDGDNWDFGGEESSWMSGVSQCYWVGITCTDNGNVMSIDMGKYFWKLFSQGNAFHVSRYVFIS